MDATTIILGLMAYLCIIISFFWYRIKPKFRVEYRVKIVSTDGVDDKFFAQIRRKWHYNWVAIGYRSAMGQSLTNDARFVLRSKDSMLNSHDTFDEAEAMCKEYKKQFDKTLTTKVQYHEVCNGN